MSLFDDLYRDLFPGAGPFDAFKLLQGLENKTVETGRALWQLSRRALAVPEVRQLLAERAPSEVLGALAATAPGQSFLADLRAYLDEYGQRGDRWGLSYPSWIEDPAPVIKHLKDYLVTPDRDLDAELAALAAERERLVAQARAALHTRPPAVRDEFEFRLQAAQTGTVLSEDHGFWIDFRAPYRVRRLLLELGHRLLDAGVVEAIDDVFYLTFDELRETALAQPCLNRRALVAGRRAEMAYFTTISPPPALGTLPVGPAPDDPLTRTLLKIFGGPAGITEGPTIVHGRAGAPGVARGTARIVHSLAQAAKLHPGDVLVAPMTAPPWTPLFATVAAVVTDTGGILSHCAVVAREYGLPAVVGAGTATSVLKDGQLVEVDGNAGTVRVVG